MLLMHLGTTVLSERSIVHTLVAHSDLPLVLFVQRNVAENDCLEPAGWQPKVQQHSFLRDGTGAEAGDSPFLCVSSTKESRWYDVNTAILSHGRR